MGVNLDPAFDRAYADWKVEKPSVWLLLLALAEIGLIVLGVRTLGWHW